LAKKPELPDPPLVNQLTLASTPPSQAVGAPKHLATCASPPPATSRAASSCRPRWSGRASTRSAPHWTESHAGGCSDYAGGV